MVFYGGIGAVGTCRVVVYLAGGGVVGSNGFANNDGGGYCPGFVLRSLSGVLVVGLRFKWRLWPVN